MAERITTTHPLACTRERAPVSPLGREKKTAPRAHGGYILAHSYAASSGASRAFAALVQRERGVDVCVQQERISLDTVAPAADTDDVVERAARISPCE